jgi:hypothetical protein
MASTYTTNLRLTKQGDGENPNSWGQILNDGVISLADEAIAGYTTISIGSAATVNLTANDGADDQSRSAFLEVKGSVGTVATSIFLVIPNKTKAYAVLNKVSANATGNVVMMRVAGNTGVTLNRSSTLFQHVICDGASVYNVDQSDATFGSLEVTGTAKFDSTVTVSGTSSFLSKSTFEDDVSVSGNSTFGGTVTIGGNTVLGGTVALNGIVTIGSAIKSFFTTITDAASIVMNLNTGNQFVVTLGANRTLAAPTNLTAGQTGHIYVYQDGTGSRTLAYNTVFQFTGGGVPTLTTTAAAVDLLVFSVRASDKVDAVLLNNFDR